jgi:hypothetical protein
MSKGNKKEKIYRHVLVSEGNYFRLKMLGYAGDSLNDVLTRILKNGKSLQQDTRVSSPDLDVSII